LSLPPDLWKHAIVGLALLAATITDLRRRQVPLWLSLGLVACGILVGALRGPVGLAESILGFAVGALPVLPFVLFGGLGGADLLLLGAIGSWEGWHAVLIVEFWTALVGALLALCAKGRNRGTIPYAPAVLVGTMLTLILP
jgi:Flp pilus assembly protein protease CpaA